VRRKSRPLLQLDQIGLDGSAAERVYRLSRRKSLASSSKPARVSSQDLCAFGWQTTESTSFFNPSTANVGLATTSVLDGDEVWQFQDTDLALIVRHHNTGCTIVGRAQLFQKTSEPDRLLSSDVERGFLSRAWRGDTPLGSTSDVLLDVPLLLRLILLVDPSDE
jgi:hypothetical protein